MEHGPPRRWPRALVTVARRVTLSAAAIALACGLATFVDATAPAGSPSTAGTDAAAGVPGGAAASSSGLALPATSSFDAARGRIADAPDDRVSVFIAPADGGRLAPGADLALTIDIVNNTTAAIAPGEAVVVFDPQTLDSRAEYTQWLEGTTGDLGNATARIPTPEIAAGAHETIEAVVAAADLGLATDAAFGPRGLAVQLESGGADLGRGFSSVVFASTLDASPTPLSVVVPITLPDSDSAVIGRDELATLTAESGYLTGLLDAVEGTSATLAIDPRLLLSIRVLEASAPASAIAWLERLEALPNDSFALPYADADLTLQRQGGLEWPLELTSADFAYASVEDAPPTTEPTESDEPTASASGAPDAPGGPDSTDPGSTDPGTSPTEGSADGEPTASGAPGENGTASTEPDPTATATETEPEPEPTEPDDGEPPTLEELLAFDYTLDGVAWPSAGTLASADLVAFADWGYRLLLTSEGSVTRDDAPSYTPDSAVNLAGWSAQVADGQLNDALDAAASATDDSDRASALAELATVLAVVSRELPNAPRTMFAALGRGAAGEPESLGATLRLLDGLEWVAPARLTVPDIGSGTVAGATVREGGHAQAVIDRFHELLGAEARGSEIATMFDEPELFRSEVRAQLLATISASWHSRLDAWIPASQAFIDYVDMTEGSVTVIPTSDIQVVGREAELPVFIRNDSGRAVTVQVVLEPRTARLEAGDPVTLRIEPGSMARAGLPARAISNGPAVADVRILTPTGVPLVSTQSMQINVQAEWETVTVIAGAVGLTTLFVWGIVRTVRRRRRERVDASPSGEAVTDDEG